MTRTDQIARLIESVNTGYLPGSAAAKNNLPKLLEELRVLREACWKIRAESMGWKIHSESMGWQGCSIIARDALAAADKIWEMP